MISLFFFLMLEPKGVVSEESEARQRSGKEQEKKNRNIRVHVVTSRLRVSIYVPTDQTAKQTVQFVKDQGTVNVP
jgi:DNA-binding response OmpR family regulator